MPPDLRITVRSERSTTCITVAGEIDMATTGQLTAAITQALHHEPALVTLLLDLAAVTFLDCAGVTALLEARAACTARGATMRTTGVHGIVLYVITLLDLAPELAGDHPRRSLPPDRRPSGPAPTGPAPDHRR